MYRYWILLLCGMAAFAQPAGSFRQKLDQIMNRPEYRHSRFGMEFYSLSTKEVLFELNAQQLFVPGSTTKLLSTGNLLAALGPDYRFHTRVYRTGPVNDGTLDGDLVLVASGDPNLSGRIQPDGTLAFENVDHSYDNSEATRAVPGDPLAVLKELAGQIASRRIRRVSGHLFVDAGLFPEGARELGTGVIISPISLNDNIVDVTVASGAEGAPARLQVSPPTAYVHFINETKTVGSGEKASFRWTNDVSDPDGAHTVTVTGSIPAGKPTLLHAWHAPEPSRFAAIAFAELLRERGVAVQAARPAMANLPPSSVHTDANLVAEHVSPPLIEEVKVTLKVSQNLHASMMPYLAGALGAHARERVDLAGFELEHAWLEKAGLDLSAAAQSDGAGGAAYFTPDFMTHYLAYMAGQKYFPAFHKALPILGKDGSLWDIQVNSPAAGHVFAKTGTFGATNSLNRNLLLLGKGLAGYLTTRDGRNLAFAIYANFVPGDRETIAHTVGDALGEIAAAAYETSLQ